MENRFDNKVALITGEALGIGRSTATIFAKNGAKVVVDWEAKAGEEL